MSIALEIAATADALAQRVADEVLELGARAIEARGRALLALSGGTTPRPLYEALASPQRRDRIDWRRVEIFYADERCVPPDAAESNHHMIAERLLAHVPIQPAHVHRIRGEAPPTEAADAYEQLLRERFTSSDASFDATLLGMGADGHTASLFPGSDEDGTRWARVALDAAHPPARVTLTPEILARSRVVIVVVSGSAKADRVRRVLALPPDPRAQPIQRITATDLRWRSDRAAGSRLASWR